MSSSTNNEYDERETCRNYKMIIVALCDYYYYYYYYHHHHYRHHYHHLHHTIGCLELICPVFELSSLISNSENSERVRLCHLVYILFCFWSTNL